jgi:hypothetical protein
MFIGLFQKIVFAKNSKSPVLLMRSGVVLWARQSRLWSLIKAQQCIFDIFFQCVFVSFVKKKEEKKKLFYRLPNSLYIRSHLGCEIKVLHWKIKFRGFLSSIMGIGH